MTPNNHNTYLYHSVLCGGHRKVVDMENILKLIQQRDALRSEVHQLHLERKQRLLEIEEHPEREAAWKEYDLEYKRIQHDYHQRVGLIHQQLEAEVEKLEEGRFFLYTVTRGNSQKFPQGGNLNQPYADYFLVVEGGKPYLTYTRHPGAPRSYKANPGLLPIQDHPLKDIYIRNITRPA